MIRDLWRWLTGADLPPAGRGMTTLPHEPAEPIRVEELGPTPACPRCEGEMVLHDFGDGSPSWLCPYDPESPAFGAAADQ